MTSSARRFGHAEDTVHLDDPEHEQSTLLGAERVHCSLSQDEEDEEHFREVLSWKRLPWWKRPSPYWLIVGTFFSSTGFAALLAPKVALYTTLACRIHRPEIVVNDSLHSFAFPSTHSLVSVNIVDTPIPWVLAGSGAAVNMVSTYTSSLDHTQDELDSKGKCASDPAVQVVVARLNAVFATSMGIVSCLTTGWWGSLSDRYGRRLVLFVSIFGLFVTEFTHVITAWFVDVLPGGYWFPLVGFLIEGLCGSMASGVAATHAYLADTTDPSTRSRYFSLFLGLMFTGVAVGPALGGFLIRSTGTLLSVFYFATVLHGVYTMLVLLVLPEPLTRARARGARLRWAQQRANQMSSGRAVDFLKIITRFLSPLVILLPERSLDGNSLKQKRGNWSLFFLAIAYGLMTSAMGAFAYKFQYAAAQFNWTPELTSYYVSLIGTTRAAFLTAVLPLIIKYFKPAPIQLPSTPDEPLRDTMGLSPSRNANSLPCTTEINAPEQRLPRRSLIFDLALARLSAGLETTAFMGMAVASTGTFFALSSTINSFAAGFSPAAQAIALDIYTNRRSQDRREIGKLYGAFSILQALGSQIISPAVYGFVYSNTVARFPQAIMIVSMCTSLLALICLSFVRVPSEPTRDQGAPEDRNEQGTPNTAIPETLLVRENEGVEGR